MVGTVGVQINSFRSCCWASTNGATECLFACSGYSEIGAERSHQMFEGDDICRSSVLNFNIARTTQERNMSFQNRGTQGS